MRHDLRMLIKIRQIIFIIEPDWINDIHDNSILTNGTTLVSQAFPQPIFYANYFLHLLFSQLQPADEQRPDLH